MPRIHAPHTIAPPAAPADLGLSAFNPPLLEDVVENAPLRVANCMRNPYDVRPAAEMILARVSAARAFLRQDRPVVLLMGEMHTKPADIALQARVIDGLIGLYGPAGANTGRGGVAAGLELPYDLLGDLVERQTQRSLSPMQKSLMSALDSHGQRSLTAALGKAEFAYAPVSKNSLLLHLHDKGLSTRFIDASIRRIAPDNDKTCARSVLNQNDPVTRHIVKTRMPELADTRINVRSPCGAALRNETMTEHSLRHIDYTGASVYFVKTGMSHLFGTRDTHFRYEQSLCASFKRAGAYVMPVYTLQDAASYGDIPYEAIDDLRRGVVVRGLSDERFCTLNSGEDAELGRLIAESGLDLEIFRTRHEGGDGETPPRHTRAHHARRLAASCEDWAEEALSTLEGARPS